MSRAIAVVTAGLSQPSTSRLLADRLAEATDRALRLRDENVEITVLELRELAHEITDHLLTGFAAPRLAAAVQSVVSADALIAVSPVFSASYSGLFKSFFDVLEDDVLDSKPVLIGATGGTARHSLALEFALRPLFAYLRAAVTPTAVFAASEDFAGAGGGTTLAARADRAGRELADLVLALPRTGPVDPFDNPTPFEQLLGNN
ncbi:MAG: FMN reductase [Nocardioides sp.]